MAGPQGLRDVGGFLTGRETMPQAAQMQGLRASPRARRLCSSNARALETRQSVRSSPGSLHLACPSGPDWSC